MSDMTMTMATNSSTNGSSTAARTTVSLRVRIVPDEFDGSVDATSATAARQHGRNAEGER